ncbi:MAG: PhnD/SsuA/transferrin family substrate-binding protein [Chroococcidiopsidaceae cyanobacterium CP_BM_RX_35]|nr:PhnD/SsuA/transferrin family substrate-binding protein [Chroococcidiopsidaceae cyanobacterium CP_BM_RX_35]
MDTLPIFNAISYLAPNWLEYYQELVLFLGRVLQCETQFAASDRDPLNDLQLWEDNVDLAFICGLPFIRYCRTAPKRLRAIAAPVMQAERYQNCPVYFSDVIVHAESQFQTFSDLVGSTVCYNDPGSNSGYYLLQYRLLQEQCSTRFFKNAVQSGSHQRSICWVIEGKADCAAIDSTVLEQEFRVFPELAHQVRIIESSEPCPMPPIVVAQHLGDDLIDQIQTALLQPDMQLKAAMTQMDVKQYAAVNTKDYDVIAQIYDMVTNSCFSQL